MSDKKISQLTGGGAAQAADEIPIARSGANFKVTGADIAAAATAVGTLTSLTVAAPTGNAQNLINLSQTWNAAGTTFAGLKFNVTDTASNAASLLMDLQVGGTSQFRVSKAGVVTLKNSGTITWTSANDLTFSSGEAYQRVRAYSFWDSNITSGIGDAGVSPGPKVHLASSATLGWTSGATVSSGTYDLILARDAADTLAQRRTTNAQTFRLYNTFTDASNYERGKLEWASNVLRIGTEKAGTGSARALEFQTDGTTRLTITTGGVVLGSSGFASTSNLGGGISNQGIGWQNGSGSYYQTLLWDSTRKSFYFSDAVVNSVAYRAGDIAFYSSTAGTTSVDIAIARSAANKLVLTDGSTGAGSLVLRDAGNIETATTTGTKIGTATGQKLGFWNADPIAQPTTAVTEATFVENAGGVAVNDDSTFDGYTIRQVVKALRNAGLLA